MINVLLRILFALVLITPSQARDLTIILPAVEDAHAINARIFSRYLSSHMSKDTKIVFKVVPGAASVTAANYIYNNAPRDGYTIGVFNKNIPLIGAIGGSNVNFDPTKFTWLGSTSDGRKDAVLLLSNKPYDGELIIGSDSVLLADPVKFIQRSLSWNIKQINGYKNNAEVRLAFERKEIDALINSLIGIKTSKPSWLNDNKIQVLLQFGNSTNRHPEFLNVPTLEEMISDNDKELLHIFETQFILLRPYVAPPDIPEDMVIELRKAFDAAVLDQRYVQEALRANIEVSLINAKEAERIVRTTSSVNINLLNLLK